MKKHIAIDLGAESGRVIVGDLVSFDIVHRFPNIPVCIHTSLYWDILNIFTEIKKGLREAFIKYPNQIVSIGIDTWGVDFVFLDKNKDMLGNPYHYRDSRTDNVPETFFQIMSRKDLYLETGIQIMNLNTVFQIFAYAGQKSEILQQAKYFLTIPDLLNYFLTGNIVNEFSNASTTQMMNPFTKQWSEKILKILKVPSDCFKSIVPSGEPIGTLLPNLQQELGAPKDVAVIAPACHDTGSAVAAVPAIPGENYAYLSSGTWSLLGIESPKPIICEKSFLYNFTNEGAADGGFRVLKNIMGLWILQECKRAWDAAGRHYTYAQLNAMAAQVKDRGARINVDDPVFYKPSALSESMISRIQYYCDANKIPQPQSEGEIVRCILESLAEKYKSVIQNLEEISEKKISRLYIIGGGSQNELLCGLTAKTLGIAVSAGPVEATALGNILVQAKTLGIIKDYAEGRQIIRSNQNVTEYLP